MAKFLVVTALCLAALAAVAAGQGEAERQRLRDAQCRQEVQESPLDACRQVVHRQLTGGARSAPLQWSTGMRMQCCQQLQDVSRECRCAAIRHMVRGYEQAMPPLEEEEGGWYYGSEPAGEGYYGGEGRLGARSKEKQGTTAAARWQGGKAEGTTARRRSTEDRVAVAAAGEEEYGESGHQRWGPGFPVRAGGTRQQTTRVRLSKVRQYAARLPMMCRMEPQECSVFSAGGQY